MNYSIPVFGLLKKVINYFAVFRIDTCTFFTLNLYRFWYSVTLKFNIASIFTEIYDSNTPTDNSPEIKHEKKISPQLNTSSESDSSSRYDVSLTSKTDVTVNGVSAATQTSDDDISNEGKPKNRQEEENGSLALLSKVAERINQKLEKVIFLFLFRMIENT
jgi:hypothetical protein